MKKKRNPQEPFTTDEAQTASLIVGEGTFWCLREKKKGRIYAYPGIDIRMCDKEVLEPAAIVFDTSIMALKLDSRECKPEDFPPDGRGIWRVEVKRGHAQDIMQRLKPLLTTSTLKDGKQTCKNVSQDQ